MCTLEAEFLIDPRIFNELRDDVGCRTAGASVGKDHNRTYCRGVKELQLSEKYNEKFDVSKVLRPGS
jgi:hypothetical protein